MKATVSEKGQVTIPKRLRESLGIRAGTQLQFEESAGRLIASPIIPRDPLEELVGLLPRMDVDRTLTELRGPSLDEDSNRKKHGHRRR